MKQMRMISEHCRYYRTATLHMTLQRMADLTEVKMSTISAFENGRSTNMQHFLSYACMGNDIQRKQFMDGFNEILGIK